VSAGTPTEAERVARVALNRLAEPGDPRLAAVVAELGAVAVRDHLLAERDLSGLRTDVASRLADLDPERDLDRAARRGIRFVIPGDREWPAGLDDLAAPPPIHGRGGPPLGLWVRGPLSLEALGGAVAVVGSRSATTYGTQVAGDLAAGVGRAGLAVVSGAAFGIDQAAHRGALGAGAGTVAVLACGVDRAYPASHRALLDHLAEHHAVVAETPPGCAPTKLRFLARNRMIAALSVGTVVVEAAVRSGALNTATWAEQLHRTVMGVPGPVTSEPSEGVHELLRGGGATLVTRADDVLELVGRAGEHLTEPRRAPVRDRDRLPRRDQQVLDAVPVLRPAATEAIARTSGIGVAEVGGCLERLEGRSLVVATAGGWRLAPGA
jgi:DNA processing protein